MTDKETEELRGHLLVRYGGGDPDPMNLFSNDQFVEMALELCLDIPKEELPLHMNHTNAITRDGVAWRLERGC